MSQSPRTCPNLFLIGAQKGGSSTLAQHLIEHADVAYYSIKEPNFFVPDDVASARSRLEISGPSEASARWLLDGSVDYARYPLRAGVPRNIFEICGGEEDLRFVYILRHPVDRAISEYFWKRERYGEYRPFEEALAEDAQYIETGQYDVQIERYLEFFSPEQFYFIKFDDYFADTDAAFGALCTWLGIPPQPVASRDVALGKTDKAMTKTARFEWLNRLAYGSPALKGLVKAILPYRMLQRTTDMLSKPVEREGIDPALRARLTAEHFTESLARTEALTGLDLSDWRASAGLNP